MMKRLLKWAGALLVAVVLVVVVCNAVVLKAAAGRTYDDIASVPHNRVGLLLGTGPVSVFGGPNPYFYKRLDAAAALYHAGKIERVLISGDNRHKDYNEPEMMRDGLIARGVPTGVIYLDYAGFRTLDSMVRAREVFGQERVTVISQQFHNERAIYLGQRAGVDAVGYNAGNFFGRTRLRKARMLCRESLARVKAVLDQLSHKQPHFLGAPIEIK